MCSVSHGASASASVMALLPLLFLLFPLYLVSFSSLPFLHFDSPNCVSKKQECVFAAPKKRGPNNNKKKRPLDGIGLCEESGKKSGEKESEGKGGERR